MSKIKEQIIQFIKKTEEKRIDWKYLNANTVRFIKKIEGNKNYTVTIAIQRTKPNPNFVFTIQSSNPNQVLLQLQTANQPEHRDAINHLFHIAFEQSQSDTIEAIDDLLNNL